MLGGVLHSTVERQEDRWRRLGRDFGQDVNVGAVLIDTDHPPTGLPVKFVDNRLLHLTDDDRREIIIGGKHFGLGRDDDAR